MAVHIALHEIGDDFERRHVSFAKREQYSPEYLAINPEGKVPTLLIDDRPLTEVAGCLYYLAKRYPEARLWPEGGLETEAQAISVDVVHRLDDPPGASRRPRALARSVRSRRAQVGDAGMDGRALFDRRHPPLPALLALRRLGKARPRRVPEPLGSLRADDGAPGGQAHDRNRKRGRLRPPAIADGGPPDAIGSFASVASVASV